jgi:hypothetical protein
MIATNKQNATQVHPQINLSWKHTLEKMATKKI